MSIKNNFLKRFFLVMLLGAVALSMLGCAPTIIYKDKIVYKASVIPKELLKHCVFTKPSVTPVAYSKMTFSEKEEFFTKYTNQLLTDGASCNTDIDAIVSFQQKQVKLIESNKP